MYLLAFGELFRLLSGIFQEETSIFRNPYTALPLKKAIEGISPIALRPGLALDLHLVIRFVLTGRSTKSQSNNLTITYKALLTDAPHRSSILVRNQYC